MKRALLACSLLALGASSACANTASPVNVWVGSLPLAVVPGRVPDGAAATGLFLNDRLTLTGTLGANTATPTAGGFTGNAQGYDPATACTITLQYSGTWSAQGPSVALTYGATTLIGSGCTLAASNGRITVTLAPATALLGTETMALGAAGLTQTYTRQP